SRRRHTRFSRDWSSDVCSSDLVDFFDDDVEEVRILDPRTFKPVRREKGCVLLPAREERVDDAAVQRFGEEVARQVAAQGRGLRLDRKSTRLNSSHVKISYAVFC